MSKRKHTFTVKSFEELAKAYPHAVTEKVIPERREQKADYAYISKLLDCKITVPGIELTSPAAADITAATSSASVKEPVPTFLKGHKHGEA